MLAEVRSHAMCLCKGGQSDSARAFYLCRESSRCLPLHAAQGWRRSHTRVIAHTMLQRSLHRAVNVDASQLKLPLHYEKSS
jgi:hypothetical protein